MSSAWPPAPRPSAAAVERREAVVRGSADGDLEAVRRGLHDGDDRVRASAYRALAALDDLDETDLATGLADPDARVRRTMAELGAELTTVDLAVLLADTDPSVVETACWAAGERAENGAAHLPRLAAIVAGHDDPLCREAAVAALGAIGAEAGLPTILAATADKATVRRRAVLALAPFDGPDVRAALEQALDDRDWQVRQAAEDLLRISDG